MPAPDPKIALFRNLINAQVTDIAWFSAAAELLGVSENLLQEPGWFYKKWNPKWGQYQIDFKEGRLVVYWDRNDEGPPCQLVSRDMANIQMTRVALTAVYAEYCKEIGRFTYMDVDNPHCSQVKVYVNGKEVEQVVIADSLLGYIDVYARNEKGKHMLDNTGEALRRQRIQGVVEIILQDERQSFF